MRTINKIILLTIAVMALSCDDVLEKDIADDTIQITAPKEGDIITSNVVNFQWNALKGADKYRVQVYNLNHTIVLDSLVENKINLTCPLLSGEYQWRVRGENFGYQSTYSFPVNFKLIESDDLTNQQIIPTSPGNGIYTKNATVTCAWQDLNVADYYKMQLINVTAGNLIVVEQSNITATSFLLTNAMLQDEAKYEWKIKGVNATSETVFSSRFFSIDRTAPDAPQNTLPADGSIQVASTPIRFTWTVPTNSGIIASPILLYSIEFSNSITFNSIIRTSPSPSAEINQTFTTPGDYYWRIKATDTALNTSVSSSPFKFIIH